MEVLEECDSANNASQLRRDFNDVGRKFNQSSSIINPLVLSVLYIGRLAKILITIMERNLKKFPMSVATMSR